MFVLTMKDGAIKGGLELGNGGLCDVVGDLLGVCGPKKVA